MAYTSANPGQVGRHRRREPRSGAAQALSLDLEADVQSGVPLRRERVRHRPTAGVSRIPRVAAQPPAHPHRRRQPHFQQSKPLPAARTRFLDVRVRRGHRHDALRHPRYRRRLRAVGALAARLQFPRPALCRHLCRYRYRRGSDRLVPEKLRRRAFPFLRFDRHQRVVQSHRRRPIGLSRAARGRLVRSGLFQFAAVASARSRTGKLFARVLSAPESRRRHDAFAFQRRASAGELWQAAYFWAPPGQRA